MIKIGDLAKICNVSTQTLRYYDAEGVLKPDITDSSSGYRFYTVDSARKSTGLGLSIAKLLTERMGGNITADYKGNTLSITICFGE